MPALAFPPDLDRIARRERSFTADEFHAMGEAGVLEPDGRYELIDGRILVMVPPGPIHSSTTDFLTRAFARRVYLIDPPLARVSVQNPLRLSRRLEPQPDVMLLRPDTPADRLPTAADALLVVEVSVSTVRFDRETKLPRYAAAGVPEVWIVLPEERTAEIYRQPEGGAYAVVRRLAEGDAADVQGLPDVPPVEVADLFPPRV